MTRLLPCFRHLTFLWGAFAAATVHPLLAADDRPFWIWTDRPIEARAHVSFFRTMDIPADVRSAQLLVIADQCAVTVSVNDRQVGKCQMFDDPLDIDVTAALRKGHNRIGIEITSWQQPPAIAVRLRYAAPDGPRQLVSDTTWRTQGGRTVALGRVARRPWLISPRAIDINPLDDYTQWKRALGAAPGTDDRQFQTAPGFEVRLIRAAATDEGSWVSLAVDPRGRFVIAREDKGLLRMTLDENGEAVAKVETINQELQECRGLVFAHDSLYANANNSKGLYRLQDRDGDDLFETCELLLATTGGVGHGRNDLTLGPDGLIYSIHGDSVDLPTSGPDLTSPSREHRQGAKTSEGHVLRLRPDGSEVTVVAAGLRNPFGIDFHQDGEMFTYDADAEHDMGAPWYRPTRVNQLVAGSDYGWRGVTGSWPPYFPDHPDNGPATLDIGKGSPTAVKFGYRSRFPETYRQALYVLDWAYGRVLAVHLAPRGAGYFGRAEPFLRGRPLNVTDLDFGPDGAMYLVTGGRKTQSALYRVRFVGGRGTAAASDGQSADENRGPIHRAARQSAAAHARGARRKLAGLLRPLGADAVEQAWPWLDHPDPQLVHAARMAIEHQPLQTWRRRALEETSPRAAIHAMLSLARADQEGSAAAMVARLNALDISGVGRRELQAAVYAYQLCLKGERGVTPAARRRAVARLEAVYPTADVTTNRIVGEILVAHGTPSVVEKTLAILTGSTSQSEQMQCLHVLRLAREGWSMRFRREYFSALRQCDDYLGGRGMPGFIESIRSDARATLSAEEVQQLGGLVEPRGDDLAELSGPPRPLVKQWRMEDFVDSLGDEDRDRNLERGRHLFTTALCARCHRYGTQGRMLGPELTSVAQRFAPRDLLREMIEPSATIAENYGRHRVVTQGGKVYEGQIIFSGDYRSPVLKLATDPLAPHRLEEIVKAEIETSSPAPQSFMPAGLLDTLTKDEVLDLMAFLRRGNRAE